MKQKVITNVFDSWEETIIWSCLQGIMGEVYTNDAEDSAMAVLGDFAFYAGNPCKELIRFQPENWNRDFIILVPQNEEWGKLIEKCYGDKAKKVTRYAIKKEPDVFSTEKLQQAVLDMPEGYELKMIEEPEYEMCRSNEWSKDLVSQYKTYDTYKVLGIGVVVLKAGELGTVSQANLCYLSKEVKRYPVLRVKMPDRQGWM